MSSSSNAVSDLTKVGHAPYVSIDGNLVPWDRNLGNISSVGMQYGAGCLDGMVHSVGVTFDGVPFIAIPDFFRHLGRHMFNSARSVLLDPVSSLEDAYRLAVEGKSAISLPTENGRLVNFEDYQRMYLRYVFACMNEGRVDTNYSRPFYYVTDQVINQVLNGPDNSFAIDPTLYNKSLVLMFERWPHLLAPRDTEFAGLNVLLTDVSLSPAPAASFIQYKSASSYQPTRGPAVKLKNDINARFSAELGFAINDVMLLDHTGRFVREASGSNCFFVRPNGSMLTPRTDGSIFPGLTRQFVLDLAASEVGGLLGLKIEHQDLYGSAIDTFARGGEMFLTGSALGLIPVKRVVVPLKPNPTSKDDFRVIEFGEPRISKVIADCYRAFSLGFGAEVQIGDKKARMDMSDKTLRVEIDRDMHERAVSFYRQKRDLPLDQIMRSGSVSLVAPKCSRVATRSNLIV